MTNPLYDALFAPHANSDATLLIGPDGIETSYGEFLETAARIANALAEAGLQPGDRLAMQIAKSPAALATYVACVQAGVVLLPLNTAYTATEVDYFVGDAEPKLLLCDPAQASSLKVVADKHNARLMTLDGAGQGSFADAFAGQPDRFETRDRAADDLAAFLYTSGTTGRSKGAMLTQENLLSNAQALVEVWRFTENDILLHALPIFHTHGLFVASNVTFLAGGSMIFLPGFNTDQMIGFLPRATTMMGVPTFYTRLLQDDRLNRDLVSHIRLFVSGSAPLLAETHTEFEKRTGHRILERYGMTETSMITSNPYDRERKPGAVGSALPGIDIRVADPETGKVLPGGEIGVVEVRGPNVFKGYWRMPEKTAAEFRADGFFITGDLGFIDDDGYLTLVGRGKDLIISGGYNIYPKELELLLDEQDGVLESAVIGVPHPDFGEGVVGVLVPMQGASIDNAAILAEIKPKVAKFKQPKALFTIDALPRNTMGKVQKNSLREKYKDTFKAS